MKIIVITFFIISLVSCKPQLIVKDSHQSIDESVREDTNEPVLLSSPTSKVVAGVPVLFYENVSYGSHERQLFDCFAVESSKPTPVAIYIHGGGFVMGDKTGLKESDPIVVKLIQEGVSICRFNYRYSTTDMAPAQFYDVAYAVQYIRYYSQTFNFDKSRLVAFGGSAGGHLSLWLAMQDMVDPFAVDPIARESSQVLSCIGINTQTTLNPFDYWQLVEGSPIPERGHLFFGYDSSESFRNELDRIKMLSAKEYEQEELVQIAKFTGPLYYVNKQAPKVYLLYTGEDLPLPLAEGTSTNEWVHQYGFGLLLQEEYKKHNIEDKVVLHAGANVRELNILQIDYILEVLFK